MKCHFLQFILEGPWTSSTKCHGKPSDSCPDTSPKMSSCWWHRGPKWWTNRQTFPSKFIISVCSYTGGQLIILLPFDTNKHINAHTHSSKRVILNPKHFPFSGRSYSKTLQQAPLSLLPRRHCQQHFHSAFTSRMLCAGSIQSERRVDSCRGDSGGPLVCERPGGGWVVYGVTSWGHACRTQQSPGVYTKVSAFSSWIRKVIGHDDRKEKRRWKVNDTADLSIRNNDSQDLLDWSGDDWYNNIMQSWITDVMMLWPDYPVMQVITWLLNGQDKATLDYFS